VVVSCMSGRKIRLSALTLALLFVGAFLLVGMIVPEVAASSARTKRRSAPREGRRGRQNGSGRRTGDPGRLLKRGR